MTRKWSGRPLSHRVSSRAGAAILAACALALGACGDDDEEEGEAEGSEPTALTLSVTDGGGEPEFTLPDAIEAGVAEITLTNEGEAPHSAQFIRTEGEHDEAEVLEGLGAAMKGEAFPEWFFAGGGTGTANPGESVTVTQALLPDSTYWLVDDEVRGAPAVFELGETGSGDAGEIEPSGNVVTAVDFAFEADTLTAGEPVTLDNAGAEPHHMIAVPMNEGATIEEVEEFAKTEKGKPPVDFANGQFTSVLEGGTEQVSAATLEAGRWALICFISNRDGGPPHAALGMVDEVVVE